jgi:hypothetical protein
MDREITQSELTLKRQGGGQETHFQFLVEQDITKASMGVELRMLFIH